jgi:hypothetical protein
LAMIRSTRKIWNFPSIVKSPDTDFLILCIHYFPSMQHTQELWFHTGSITNTKDGRFHFRTFDL